MEHNDGCCAWTCLRMWHTWLQYKFIVDGEWRYAADQPAMYDDMNNVNNTLEVQEYVPENLDSLEGFEPPPSPPERCASTEARSLQFSANIAVRLWKIGGMPI